jgi:hypothetical protein
VEHTDWGAQGESGDAVWVSIPPSSTYLRTVRLVAADAADRAGLDCHEVEDFRIAIDELCHFLMTSTDYGIWISFFVRHDAVSARGFAHGRDGATLAPLEDLSQRIVSSVVDYFDTEQRDGELTFSVVKHRTMAARP